MASEDVQLYRSEYAIAGDIGQIKRNQSLRQTSITGYFDLYAFHAVAIALAVVNRAQMISLTSLDYSVVTYNHPLPRLPETVINEKVINFLQS